MTRAVRRSRRMSLGPSTVLTCKQVGTQAITIIAAARAGDAAAGRWDAGRRTAGTRRPRHLSGWQVATILLRGDFPSAGRIGGQPRQGAEADQDRAA
jgi:hypothetical protein